MDFTPDAKRVFHLQSYGPPPSIEGVRVIDLKRHADDGGSMTELARLVEGRPEAGQVTGDRSGVTSRAAGEVHAVDERRTGEAEEVAQQQDPVGRVIGAAVAIDVEHGPARQ